MTNKEKVIILIESELYKYIKTMKAAYTVEEAERLINEYTEKFKETVLERCPVENIDGLIESTLKRIDENKERDD